MAEATKHDSQRTKFQLTADEWAVIAALALALLVRVGLIQRVPW
jgi:hypothetical protein